MVVQVDTNDYVESNEWALLEHPAKSELMYHRCCEDPYRYLMFRVKLKRIAVFYNYILVLPCVLLSFLTLVIFWLPPEQPAKILLGKCLSLSLSVCISVCLSVCLSVCKGKGIAPLRESPPHKRSGMARVLKGSHSFSYTPTRSSAIGMSHTCLRLPSRSWYSFTDPEGWNC